MSRIGEPRLLLWVTYGLSAPPSCESEAGGTADEIKAKADFGAQTSVAGGGAEELAGCCELRLIAICGRLPVGKGFLDGKCRAGRCCHLFGLFLRRSEMAAGHNALRRSGPGHKHAVAMLQWLKWGVLISGSTGWVHYSSLALSNLMGASGCPRVSQVACDRGSW